MFFPLILIACTFMAHEKRSFHWFFKTFLLSWTMNETDQAKAPLCKGSCHAAAWLRDCCRFLGKRWLNRGVRGDERLFRQIVQKICRLADARQGFLVQYDGKRSIPSCASDLISASLDDDRCDNPSERLSAPTSSYTGEAIPWRLYKGCYSIPQNSVMNFKKAARKEW